MNFVEIVETVEGIESKFDTLSEAQLKLTQSLLTEGADLEFDVTHHIDYLVEFVKAHSDENAVIIAEAADCGKVMKVVLDAVRKNTTDKENFIAEALENVGNIDVELVEGETTEGSVTLLSVVTNTLTEMLGEETVEDLPAEMVFDIVNEAKELDISDDADDMNLVELVEEISTKMEESIKEGVIDLDTADYEGETLAEFLDDYSDTTDLLEEMEAVTDEVLNESEDKEGARLMGKAKEATIMVEAKLESYVNSLERAKEAKSLVVENAIITDDILRYVTTAIDKKLAA
jgi:hypothetical protein